MRKIKFTDIVGMLERDEMREITGGCGQSYGSASGWGGGGGGSSFGSIMGMGFGGGASYGGSSSGSSSSSSASSYSSANYSSNNYSNGWSNTAGGLTTNDPKAISRYFDFVYANNGVVTNAQTNDFIRNEATVAGQQANNVAYAIQLNPVPVVNNYHGPSTIPQGIVIDNNGFLQVNNIGTTAQNSGGSSSAIYLPQGVPPTDCVFQCMAQIGALYGDSSLNFTAMKANYDTIYKVAIASGSVAPAVNGVNEILLSNFVDQYFNRADVTTSQLDSFIQGNDNFAIGVFRKYSSDGTKSELHAVILTGTNGTAYTYTDPQLGGKEGKFEKNCLLSFVAITGICP